MRYQVLATDFDDTIAYEGTVDDETLLALKQVRSAGMGLILVTGRELSDLFNTFLHSHLFDVIVAENGAVLYEPSNGTTQIIGAPVPPQPDPRAARSANIRRSLDRRNCHAIRASGTGGYPRAGSGVACDLQQGSGDGSRLMS